MQLKKKGGEDENYHLANVCLHLPVTFFSLSKRLILQESIEGRSQKKMLYIYWNLKRIDMYNYSCLHLETVHTEKLQCLITQCNTNHMIRYQ